MKITGDDLVELMFLPMSDEKIIEIIDKLGLEQPTIDEEYFIEQEISIIDEDNSGITFVFKEINGYTEDGEPCLVEINFLPNKKINLPFAIKFSDDLQTVIQKLGKKFDFNDKWSKFTKIWVKNIDEKLKYNFILLFSKDFKQIKSCVIIPFEKEDVGYLLLENKE